MIARLLHSIRRLVREERGASAAFFALMIVPLTAMMGFALDLGHVLLVRNQMQNAADSAAVAGAYYINRSGGDPITVATQYGTSNGMSGGKSKTTATLMCLNSTGVTCTGSPSANAIVVTQTATVGAYFAEIVSFDNFDVKVTAVAGAGGGQAIPMNVAMIVDTTQSMTNSDSNCSISGATRLDCALAGARTLLGALSSSIDQVTLMTFPPVKKGDQSKDYDCNKSTTPTIDTYAQASGSNPAGTYVIIPATTDYQLANSQNLNSSSNLVKAVQGGSCTYGMAAKGGVGTFYADAIKTAQANLVATDKAGQQNVIILLSDGDANAAVQNVPSGEGANQCGQAVTQATKATQAGTWVYSIAYGTGKTGGCSTDAGKYSACSAMTKIASDSSKFYSDTSGAGASGCSAGTNSMTDLVAIFKSISQTLLRPRLLSRTVLPGGSSGGS